MSLRKYLGALLLVTLNISSLSPSALFAKSENATALNASQSVSLPKEVRGRFLKEKQQLQSLGNPEEYKNVEVEWSVGEQKPSKIRSIHKKASKDVANDTKKVMGDFSALYGASGGTALELRLEKNSLSKLTKEHHARLKQFHNNLEIVWGDIISHVDKNGFLYQIDGAMESVPTTSTKPAISSKAALVIGEKEQGKKANFQVTKKPELVLYKFASSYILAYRYTLSYDDPIAHAGQWIYYIDANTGKKINAYNTIDSALVPAALSGALLNSEGGGVKTFTGTYNTTSGKYIMQNMFSSSGSYYIYNNSSNTGTYTDARAGANRSTSDWGTSDPVEVSATYNITKTLEYYNALGFGTDNIVFSTPWQTYLPISLHYGTNYPNAYWSSGVGLFIGDGDGVSMKPLATLDVMAHEFGHAWTENTSDLVYQNEPGALNESFSDISGVNVEFSTQQSAKNMYPNTGSGLSDWLIWEDIMIGTKALRDMRNPANTATVGTGNEQPTKYKGTYWYFGSGDNGGVHYNSSIQNFFYYLLTEGGSGNNEGILYSVDGIGIEAARRIAFETPNFVTTTTDYKGVRQSWIDAANSLHPTDSSFAASVKAAWDAVGVSDSPIIEVSSSESFEDDTNLPIGWSTSVGTGGTTRGEAVIGNPWAVSTSTGALWSHSLVSGAIGHGGSTSVYSSGTTDSDGVVSFSYRTSSEANWDFLSFYVDGTLKKQWSGINPWSSYSESITSGSHTFQWEYSKDDFCCTAWLDQVGIDAVHITSLTGALDYGSDTGSGQYVSSAGFHGTFDGPAAYGYVISRSDGQMAKGSASGSLSFPLVGFPEGSGSIDFQYRDSNGFLSKIFTKSFFLDSLSPDITHITSPANGSFTNTGNVTLFWDSITDSGAGLPSSPYTYLISTDSGFADIVLSGTTNVTNSDLFLADSTYYAKIQVRDLAGNTSTSPVVSFTIDTITPDTPTNVVINNGNIIDASTQTGVTISGSGGVSESGSIVYYTISASSGSVSGSGLVDRFGSFHFSGIDVSGLEDGILSYTVYVIDLAWNGPSGAFGTIGKSVIPAAGNLTFISGAYTNTSTTSIRVSAGKPVSYLISGSGIVSDLTGSLESSGSVMIPVELSANDGNKVVQIIFTDSAEVSTTTFASIALDTTPPILSIGSHTNNEEVTGSSALLTGSIFDINGIVSATLNSATLLSSSNWSKSVSLTAWTNAFTLTAVDNAGNSGSISVNINRLVASSNIVTSYVPTGIEINFDTDLSATGVIVYGTNTGSFDFSQNAISVDWFHHATTLEGLTPDTQYYYELCGAYDMVACLFGPQNPIILSFHTPKVVDITNITNIVSTGAIVFSGASATGSTVFQGTGSLSIKNENTPTDTVTMSMSGLVITTSGTGAWDGLLETPNTTVLTGVTLTEIGYTLTGSVYKAGNDSVGLSFSGQSASVQIYVGTALNGKFLHVYRSDSGPVFSFIDTCTVSAGMCQFQTNHFSYFAFGDPNDSTPNTFVFTPQTGVELGANTDSNAITLSGTNTAAIISMSGGSYSINSLAFTTATGTISAGDTVKVRLVSSASYSTLSQATLTIGGVSANFSVTTKAAPVVSSGGGGWGGGGGGGMSMDACPKGDTSGSYYDGKCEKAGAPSSSSTVAIVTVSGTNSVGFLSGNPIVAAYTFPDNERIPQKVAAELNFFVSKLTKALDAKAGNNEKKKSTYNQAVAKYMLDRAKKTNNKREKQIFAYLCKRFSIVTKIEIK